MKLYAKALVALVGAAAMLLPSFLSDGHISVVEGVQISVAVATAGGVWLAANVPTLTVAKTLVAALLAALNLVVTYLTTSGHLTASNWANVAIAVLTALGVYGVANSGSRAGNPAGRLAAVLLLLAVTTAAFSIPPAPQRTVHAGDTWTFSVLHRT